MKRVLDITEVLSTELKSRYAVDDLSLYIKNTECPSVTVDFAKVKFATRSFVDQYYNVFMTNGHTKKPKVTTINIPHDISAIFETVKQTQHKAKKVNRKSNVITCKTFAEMKHVFSHLVL